MRQVSGEEILTMAKYEELSNNYFSDSSKRRARRIGRISKDNAHDSDEENYVNLITIINEEFENIMHDLTLAKQSYIAHRLFSPSDDGLIISGPQRVDLEGKWTTAVLELLRFGNKRFMQNIQYKLREADPEEEEEKEGKV